MKGILKKMNVALLVMGYLDETSNNLTGIYMQEVPPHRTQSSEFVQYDELLLKSTELCTTW